ncbi:hypothetical protein [Frankia sp. Cas3]|uniref:hypothetical protein n=1 Tax=Frankia sp. Cas3 TaxID=3073926 RepID=UPI002AD3EE15|nr:hypothetical protein [Frankia sp. Cas3]
MIFRSTPDDVSAGPVPVCPDHAETGSVSRAGPVYRIGDIGNIDDIGHVGYISYLDITYICQVGCIRRGCLIRTLWPRADRGGGAPVADKRLLSAVLQVVDQFELLADTTLTGWSGGEKVRQAAVDRATGLQPDKEQPGALQV